MVVVFLLGVAKLYSQQLPHILFYKENLNYFNPAVTGMEGSVLFINHRSQWLSIPDAPETTSIRFNANRKKNASWGFMVESDQIFIENRISIAGDYSYQINLDEQSTLNFGLRVGFYNSFFELENLNRISNEPNEILEAVSPYIGNIIGAGIHYNRTGDTADYFFSLATPNLVNFRRFKTTYNIYTQARDERHYYLVGGVHFKSGVITLIPHFLMRAIKNAPALYSGMLGINYQNDYEMGVGITNNHYMSGYVQLKNFKSFAVSAGYEFATRLDETSLRAGTIEINLKYKFGNSKESFTTEEEIKATLE